MASAARAARANGLKRARDWQKPLTEESYLGVPDDLWANLDDEFNFTVDAASSDANYRVERHWTLADDGLSQSWENEVVWVNPLFDRQSHLWVVKALRTDNCVAVYLLPASTSSQAFKFVWDHSAQPQGPRPGCEIRFCPHRLRYKGAKNPAAFDSMVVVIRKGAVIRRV
jgi:DNA N-6-adenine-methyltransferase (Dam)